MKWLFYKMIKKTLMNLIVELCIVILRGVNITKRVLMFDLYTYVYELFFCSRIKNNCYYGELKIFHIKLLVLMNKVCYLY